MEDIEIARNTQLEKITKIAEEMNIQEDQLENIKRKFLLKYIRT